MLVFVAHKNDGNSEDLEKAKQITKQLQAKDLENCYICPTIAFQHLADSLLGQDDKMALALDILTICDILLVASDIDASVNEEIEFANLVGMEVKWLEEQQP